MGRAFLPLLILALTFAAHTQSFDPTTNSITTRLEGVVRSGAGVPVANAAVQVRALRTGATVYSGFTASDGSFAASDIPEGEYELLVQKGTQSKSTFAETSNTVHVVLDDKRPVQEPYITAVASLNDLKAPQGAKDALHTGMGAFLKRDFHKAQKQFEKALRIYPEYAAAQTYLSAILAETEPQRATELATNAVHNDPDNALAHVLLAADLNNRRQLDKGRAEAEAALRTAPTMWQAHFELGRAQAGTGQLEAALGSMTRADDFSGRRLYKITSVRCQILELLSRHDEARETLSAWIAHNQKSIELAQAQEALREMDRLARK